MKSFLVVYKDKKCVEVTDYTDDKATMRKRMDEIRENAGNGVSGTTYSVDGDLGIKVGDSKGPNGDEMDFQGFDS